jgi:peptide/nickel transport system ATP-binding protein/oligopeptide transport system ATP-binding protein
VACHFAGELGQHPATPVTAGLLGVDDQGSPTSSGPAATPVTSGPGYEKEWFDVKTRQMASGASA